VPLAVFDIDGKLTDTVEVDVECYEAAILSELGLRIPDDWPGFAEVTDPAILATACERHGVPVPDRRTEERIAARVGELLAASLAFAPERFRAIPGARRVFEHLEREGWSVAMATGAWRPSAMVKLEGAGIAHRGVPLATASDHATRAAIIGHAVESVPGPSEGPVVYIGDGVWDGRAARSLGYRFVGVARDDRASELSAAGADAVIPDFRDPASFLRHLGRVVAP